MKGLIFMRYAWLANGPLLDGFRRAMLVYILVLLLFKYCGRVLKMAKKFYQTFPPAPGSQIPERKKLQQIYE